ncbi:MAG: enoyl-(acyl carrier protein) reductase [Bacillales bacterium]|jgi:enoyl-[acyl-carrier protein] reductase I|nr:enoyl-(acyl carrier protein) reductase [Bacillales bacterium]
MSLNVQGKTFIVTGVANHRSIAWGIAKSLHAAGANLIFTYAMERMAPELKKLVSTLEGAEDSLLLECDVTEDSSIKECFEAIKTTNPVVHGLVHCIAYANRDDLKGEYMNTTREGFLLAHNISAYSLTAMAKEVRSLMTEGGGIVTLTYLGGERVVENYNVMGVAKASLDASMKYLAKDLGQENIRVNAISAGPIRTLSAKGVGDFNQIVKIMEEKAPLRRATTQEEVGDVALFLLSDLSRGITGDILHVDSGYHTLALS